MILSITIFSNMLDIMNSNLKQIAISKQNYDLLKSLGQAGDSFNDVITQLLKHTSYGNFEEDD
jgi:Putative antitoxin